MDEGSLEKVQADDAMAILADERDLLWLAIEGVEQAGAELSFNVHMLAREEPTEPPVPFLSGYGYREPLAGLRALVKELGAAASGEVIALRHDPISDGLSIELKAQRGGESFEVVLWLDLLRMSRAMRARATRGRQQSGLRFFCSRGALAQFSAQLSLFLTESRALQ
ncbi:MAG: hypothetical protein CMP23_03410 [Rickettsiales bacterium]|nr:hypothetical protein [Rickettsiales bacterium]|tara:strand:- start:717 stop:1217 length:501 start_codon:yes stop_codon:yes gene_type:complete